MRRPRGRPRHPDVLTPTEWRIADLVRHGLSRREVAHRSGVSLDAVKYHLRRTSARSSASMASPSFDVGRASRPPARSPGPTEEIS